jgi:delta-aminolevulinic acid dehydratase/porphobilinogen synthase
MLKEQRPAASAAACTASVLRDRVFFHVDVDTWIEAITGVKQVVAEGADTMMTKTLAPIGSICSL